MRETQLAQQQQRFYFISKKWNIKNQESITEQLKYNEFLETTEQSRDNKRKLRNLMVDKWTAVPKKCGELVTRKKEATKMLF